MKSSTTPVRDLILSRRSIFDFQPGPVPRATLHAILEAGIWAPNHKHTEPWRFTLIGETTRQALARRYGEIQKARGPDMSPAAQAKRAEAGIAKFLQKPTVVVVACLQEGDEMQRREDYAATCCAIQNIQLAAWEAGVGVQWSTNPLTRDPETFRLLGIDAAREHVVAFLYMGHAAKVPRAQRLPLRDVLRETP